MDKIAAQGVGKLKVRQDGFHTSIVMGTIASVLVEPMHPVHQIQDLIQSECAHSTWSKEKRDK